MTSILFALTIVFVGGMALAFQTPINAQLSRAAGDGVFAAAASFFVGFATLFAFMVLRGKFPAVETLRQIPIGLWAGGMLGAFYVWAALTSVQKLGVLSLVAALICGQLLAALIVDATGILGIEQRDITWQRLLAVVMVGGGLVLSRL